MLTPHARCFARSLFSSEIYLAVPALMGAMSVKVAFSRILVGIGMEVA
jgi:hypothetical protein